MKLRHIYINKEGEPMANHEMEYPKNPDKNMKSEDGMFEWTVYDGKVEEYHSGLLPFEDGHSVDFHLWMRDQFEDYQRPKPDTLIPVDLEVEVVDQEVKDCQAGAHTDFCTLPNCSCPSETRKVLRIKN